MIKSEINRRQWLYEAYLNGRDSKNIVSYHGTSIQVLNRILESGFHPGSHCNMITASGKEIVREGDVFVFPIEGRTKIKGTDGSLSEKLAFKEAREYAMDSSKLHYFSQNTFYGELTCDPKVAITLHLFIREFKKHDNKISESMKRQAFYKNLIHSGKSHNEIQDLLKRCTKREGLVIGYTKDIFLYDPNTGDSLYDVRVLRPTIEHIVGIEPLDEESLEYLEGLSKK